MDIDIDTSENELLRQSPEVLDLLLKDHTTQNNIFWATSSYSSRGNGFQYNDPITTECITGENGFVIRPRAVKNLAEQTERTKDMAEVFTPSWVCNAQNNLIDDTWFGRHGVFNVEDPETKTWKPTAEPVSFPKGKTWQDYVRSTRLEITCGEAPYLVSRYDTVTGKYIPIGDRIGVLDRKLRVISENVSSSGKWLKMAQAAYQHTYAYEWQGDNLLLAREALLITFIEYFEAKFGRRPLRRSIEYIAYIISWNVFQMDGLKCVVPGSCHLHDTVQKVSLFGETEEILTCEGCQKESIKDHNGIYCLVRDWGAKDPVTGEAHRKIRFVDLINS
ncbi:MAG: restriction endonuclease subunit M [Porphyromonas sp.]|nr:restriction endonuclease subunit M [Bacteroidales bacterium]MDY3100031.1 restriction endonuclease subunit M [Porphyromonas sp.]